jgi:penicillin-binding protein 2
MPVPRPLVEPLSTVEEGFFGSFSFYRRVGVLMALALAAFALLTLRAWSLQLLHSTKYLRTSQSQQMRIVNLPSARGAIVDDQLRPLASVGAALAVVADVPALGPRPFDRTWKPAPRGRRVLTHLSQLSGVRVSVLINRIRTSLVRSPFAPAVILPHAPRDLTFYLDERSADFEGLHVVAVPTRAYPQGRLGGEFLGLLGEVSPTELKQTRYGHTRPGEIVGQSGLEATYDRYLNVGFAHARVRVNALGEIVSALRPLPAKRAPGRLVLTVDARIQRAAERAIKHGIQLAHKAGYNDASAGAAVVMNAHTGALLALASAPSFNQAQAEQDPRYLSRLLDGKVPGLPLINRATQGVYPAGSTFKPIVAEAALAGGIITPYSPLACTGSLLVGGRVFHNVEPAINAELTLPQALEISCDTWFYRLGESFYARQLQGWLGIQQWARALGLGRQTGIDIPGEAAGVIPTPAWLKRSLPANADHTWYEGYSVNLSIGQGFLGVTPLQMAVAYATLANGGTVVRPHLGAAIWTSHGRRALEFPPQRKVKLQDVWAIRDGLYLAAHDQLGTSSAIFSTFPVPVAGKTGTAEVPGGSDDSWYASWAPSNNPRYVVVVLIEHGGFGADAAAPAARDIYSALFHVSSPTS